MYHSVYCYILKSLQFILLTKYYYVDRVNLDKICGECGMWHVMGR
jgi:hypothetical protein